MISRRLVFAFFTLLSACVSLSTVAQVVSGTLSMDEINNLTADVASPALTATDPNPVAGFPGLTFTLTVSNQEQLNNDISAPTNVDNTDQLLSKLPDFGQAVAVMGASTLTNADAERKLARLVFDRLGNGERLGDAVTNAKQEYALENPNDLDVLLGWTLLGLPDLVIN